MRERASRTTSGLALIAAMLVAAALPGCATHGSAYNAQKVTVCHKDRKTLVLPESAVSAHLGHGDAYGPCG